MAGTFRLSYSKLCVSRAVEINFEWLSYFSYWYGNKTEKFTVALSTNPLIRSFCVLRPFCQTMDRNFDQLFLSQLLDALY